MRRDISGFDVRWDDERARAARAAGAWFDRTIADFADEMVAREPDRLLVVDREREFTVRDIHGEAQRLARALIGRGLTPGSTISFQLPNWYEAVVIALAASMAGLVLGPITPIYREKEVGFMLADSRARLIFIPGTFRGFDHREMMRRTGSDAEVVVVRDDPQEFTAWESLLAEGGTDAPLPGTDPDAVKLVMYTSGTTGRAKGVLHSHNTLQTENWARQVYHGVTAADVLFNPSPVTHVTGMLYSLCLPFTTGVPTILLDVWEPELALDMMRRRRATGMIASTIFLDELLTVAKRQQEHLPDLRLYLCGGAQVRPELIYEAAHTFSNCTIARLYGATEVPNITGGVDSRALIDKGAETDGWIFGCEAKVVDPQTGAPLPPGADGEIVARGPQMFLGYTRAEDNAQAFDADGFFRMGDLGRIDDGFITITGRKKDLIIRAGENISPKEIEDILLGHPAIADIAIVAMPSARTGEAACAFVIVQPGATIDLPEIARFLIACGTAKQKIPERLEIVDDMPRTAIGKIRKDVLRETARRLVEAEAA